MVWNFNFAVGFGVMRSGVIGSGKVWLDGIGYGMVWMIVIYQKDNSIMKIFQIKVYGDDHKKIRKIAEHFNVDAKEVIRELLLRPSSVTKHNTRSKSEPSSLKKQPSSVRELPSSVTKQPSSVDRYKGKPLLKRYHEILDKRRKEYCLWHD